jgi:hypothetical protein
MSTYATVTSVKILNCARKNHNAFILATHKRKAEEAHVEATSYYCHKTEICLFASSVSQYNHRRLVNPLLFMTMQVPLALCPLLDTHKHKHLAPFLRLKNKQTHVLDVLLDGCEEGAVRYCLNFFFHGECWCPKTHPHVSPLHISQDTVSVLLAQGRTMTRPYLQHMATLRFHERKAEAARVEAARVEAIRLAQEQARVAHEERTKQLQISQFNRALKHAEAARALAEQRAEQERRTEDERLRRTQTEKERWIKDVRALARQNQWRELLTRCARDDVKLDWTYNRPKGNKGKHHYWNLRFAMILDRRLTVCIHCLSKTCTWCPELFADKLFRASFIAQSAQCKQVKSRTTLDLMKHLQERVSNAQQLAMCIDTHLIPVLSQLVIDYLE